MKNQKQSSTTGIAALAVIITTLALTLSLTACPNPTSGDGGGGGAIVISGTLGGGSPLPSVNIGGQESGGRLKSVSFTDVKPEVAAALAFSVSPSGQTFRGEVSGASINGLLQDGDSIYDLKGSYDSAAKTFTMQAGSGDVVFSIDGKLNSGNKIAAGESKATVYVKDGAEWKTYGYSITPGDQTISGAANQSGGAEIPAWGRGQWYDQILGTQIVVGEKVIWVFYPNGIINNLTIIEIADVNDNNAKLLARGSVYGTNVHFTARFYCANSYDSTLSSTIGSLYLPYPYDTYTVNDAVNSLPAGQKLFVAPYCSTTSSAVYKQTDGIPYDYVDSDGYSPMFKTRAGAIAATTLRVIPDFTLPLMKNRPY
jgi:hypothetical protein